MPVTRNGTAWRTLTTTLPNGDAAVIGASNTVLDARGARPGIIYAHGNQGPYNQFETLNAWSGLREWIVDNGWFWVESYGAGNQWGGPRGVESYKQARAWAYSIFQPTAFVGVLRSMGGCYARSFVEDGIGCSAIIINSGVLDVVYRGRATTGDSRAIWPAYGVDNEDDLPAASASLDPMQAPLTTWANTDVLQLWGSADTTVPPSRNSLAWNTKYGSRAKSLAVYERPGGDHSQANGSYLDVAPMAAFLTRIGGGGALPPTIPTYAREVSAHLWHGGQFYELTDAYL